MRALGLLATLVLAVVPVTGIAQAPAFDVVSVKRASDLTTRAMRPVVGEVRPGGIWIATDATLVGLVRYAYPGHALNAQIVGGADWTRRDLFDVEARGHPGASSDEWRLMVRAMLAERFRLATHVERRDLPGHALVRRRDGRLGEGLTAPTFDCAAYRAASARGESPPGEPGRPTFGDRLPCGMTMMPVLDHTRRIPGADWRLTAGSTTVAAIVPLLARALDRPVIDRTGLTQLFDVELQYSRELRPDAEPGPSLTNAVREQFGLQLDDVTVPSDVLVIDRVEPPTPN